MGFKIKKHKKFKRPKKIKRPIRIPPPRPLPPPKPLAKPKPLPKPKPVPIKMKPLPLPLPKPKPVPIKMKPLPLPLPKPKSLPVAPNKIKPLHVPKTIRIATPHQLPAFIPAQKPKSSNTKIVPVEEPVSLTEPDHAIQTDLEIPIIGKKSRKSNDTHTIPIMIGGSLLFVLLLVN